MSRPEIAVRSLLQAEQLGRTLETSQQNFLQDFCTCSLNATLFTSILGLVDLAGRTCLLDPRIIALRICSGHGQLNMPPTSSIQQLSTSIVVRHISQLVVSKTDVFTVNVMPDDCEASRRQAYFDIDYLKALSTDYIYIYVRVFALQTVASFWWQTVQRCWNGRFSHLCMPKPLRLLASKGQGIRGESTHFFLNA